MRQFITKVIISLALSVFMTTAAYGQDGSYDLWLCLERCDASDRESLAYTRAELVLTTAPLELDSLPSPLLLVLDLTAPGVSTTANGCIITHIVAGRVYHPESDLFSLLEWESIGESVVRFEAPQDPPGYTIELVFGEEIQGTGTSGTQPIFVSGASRSTDESIQCADVAARVPAQ